MSWYPDPYEVDTKGRFQPRALGLSYVMKGLRGPVAWSAAVCCTFAGVDCLMEGLRDKHMESTWVNSTIAGAASGAVMGMITRRVDVMTTSALGVGILMGLLEFNNSMTEHAQLPRDPLPPGENKNSVLDGLKKKYPEYKNL